MYLVLVAGGHSSGKRTVTNDLVKKLESEAESVTPLNLKVVDLAEYQRSKHKPDSDLGKLKEEIDQFEKENVDVLIVFGNYALFDEELSDRAHLKIFLDTDADVRLSQWILRDSVNGKQIPLADVLEEYLNNCRSEYEDYIEYTKHRADVLLPRGSDSLSIELLATGILEEILKKDQNVVSSLRRSGTPMINLRAEVASSFENSYYSTA